MNPERLYRRNILNPFFYPPRPLLENGGIRNCTAFTTSLFWKVLASLSWRLSVFLIISAFPGELLTKRATNIHTGPFEFCLKTVLAFHREIARLWRIDTSALPILPGGRILEAEGWGRVVVRLGEESGRIVGVLGNVNL